MAYSTEMDIENFLNINWKTLLLILLILIGAAILSRLTYWLINKSFNTASEKLNVDPTRYKFFKNAASMVIWLMAFAVMLSLTPQLKALAYTLFAGAGILVAILGFAAQQAFSNIIGGVFVVLFRPFRVGDMIKVGDLKYGIVEDITLRHTVINDFENKRIIIPNAVVNSETIINDSIGDLKVCRFIEVGISYDSDVDLAIRIIQEEAIKHPSCIDNRTSKQKKSEVPQVIVRVLGYGESSVDLRAYVWTNDPLYAIEMHSDINKAFKKRFDAEGIEIPFPYRTIVYKKDTPSTVK